MSFQPCVLIPTYNNPATIRAVVEGVYAHLPHVIVVDDGSDAPARAELAAIEEAGLADVISRHQNGGKGAAVKTGFWAARERGYTHVLQIDGDGQHDVSVIDAFLAAGEQSPRALVIGYPQYDASAPKHRLSARKFTNFWVNLEVGGPNIVRDAMVGVRLYPLNVVCALPVWGDRMDFDIEIAVRYAWTGHAIINLPVPVRYLSDDEGGVSHFRLFEDNLRFAWLHTRLCTQRVFGRLFSRRQRALRP